MSPGEILGFIISLIRSTLCSFSCFIDMNTITVNIPQDLSDITVSQFQRILQLQNETDFDIKAMAFCSIIYGMTREQVKRSPRKELNFLVTTVEKLIHSEAEFTNRFTLDGIEYGFIPDLDRITAGEWVDLEEAGFHPERYCDLLSILYRPITETIGERYLIEPYKAVNRSEAFKKAPASLIVGALLFFYHIGMDCMLYIQSSQERTQISISSGKDSIRDGDGTAQ